MLLLHYFHLCSMQFQLNGLSQILIDIPPNSKIDANKIPSIVFNINWFSINNRFNQSILISGQCKSGEKTRCFIILTCSCCLLFMANLSCGFYKYRNSEELTEFSIQRGHILHWLFHLAEIYQIPY